MVSYIPKIQTVRGEERQIAYGWVEDSPWEGERDAGISPTGVTTLRI